MIAAAAGIIKTSNGDYAPTFALDTAISPQPGSQWHKRIAMPKRGYSREFSTVGAERIKCDIDKIPPQLYAQVKAKATKAGISLRTLTLRLWKEWLSR